LRLLTQKWRIEEKKRPITFPANESENFAPHQAKKRAGSE
jgi:hypothetical protein